MTPYNLLILALWIVFIGFWGISAIGAKRNVGGRPWGKEIALRLIVAVLIIVVLRVPAWRDAFRSAEARAAASTFLGLAGVALCALGFGFAIWARVCLGRNWGLPMSRKENPELVTNGPYAFVRHPIYGGMLLAMLGTTLGLNVLWALPLILAGAYFLYSARREEKLMTEQFPRQYPAYKSRTKMLLPFVL
jgi:protein-S-isoprenylcysteine O-methyltransferase Ste14